jgi:hypothetical protein
MTRKRLKKTTELQSCRVSIKKDIIQITTRLVKTVVTSPKINN